MGLQSTKRGMVRGEVITDIGKFVEGNTNICNLIQSNGAS